MFSPRTATGLTMALLALPATATAQPTSPDRSGGGDPTPVVQPNPDNRIFAPTSSLAGTTPQSLISPDAADAARAGDIARAMEHYERAQPVPAAARPASPPEAGFPIPSAPASSPDDTPAWPEIAFAGFVLLATTGGVVSVRLRRRQRVAA
jgi:hypothetical protein